MKTITIPKRVIKNDDIVLVPKKEYEKLWNFWASAEFLTKRDKKSIEKGFQEIKNGKFFNSREVKKALGL
ncbi:MAG: hypothetical protein AAB556_00805 [Patescibacteria group bacterium]